MNAKQFFIFRPPRLCAVVYIVLNVNTFAVKILCRVALSMKVVGDELCWNTEMCAICM